MTKFSNFIPFLCVLLVLTSVQARIPMKKGHPYPHRCSVKLHEFCQTSKCMKDCRSSIYGRKNGFGVCELYPGKVPYACSCYYDC